MSLPPSSTVNYLNKNMYPQDDKPQIKQFLNEWLQICLTAEQVNVELQS